MPETNKNELMKNNNSNNLPENQQMDTMYYRPNEANLNYNGITLNINIPVFVENVKKFRNKRLEKKGLKELKKLEQKTMTDVQHHEVIYEEVENEEKEK